MKCVRLLFILGALLSAHLIEAQYTLTFNLSGFDDYIGRAFHLRVIEQSSGK